MCDSYHRLLYITIAYGKNLIDCKNGLVLNGIILTGTAGWKEKGWQVRKH